MKVVDIIVEALIQQPQTGGGIIREDLSPKSLDPESASSTRSTLA